MPPSAILEQKFRIKFGCQAIKFGAKLWSISFLLHRRGADLQFDALES